MQALLSETDQEERSALLRELNAAIISFLELSAPVYLEGLGLIVPSITSGYRTHVWQNKTVVRHETRRTIIFEKCYELTSYHRSRFPGIIETRELTKRIYPRLPLHMSILWSERKARGYLRGMIEQIKHEIVVRGHSGQLGAVGDFFALHNRQGTSMQDWYAGADIFLDPYYEETLDIGSSRICDRPILDSSWEILEAAHGHALAYFEVDLLSELGELGYDLEHLKSELGGDPAPVRVAVFVDEQHEGTGSPVLIYCTDGLRHAGINSLESRGYGSEFIFQVPVKWAEIEEYHEDAREVPVWPARPITLAWILMNSAKSKSVRTGVGLSAGVPLNRKAHGEITSIFTAAFTRAKGMQQSTSGEFSYINVLGISEDEAKVARKFSADYLNTLLRYKKIDQITKPMRSSIVTRTNLLEEEPLQDAGTKELESSTAYVDETALIA
jgi:hypothetical protein